MHELFVKGLIIGIFVSAPMGPIAVFAIQRVLSRGIWIGFLSGIGAAFADMFYAILAGLGISFIVDFLLENQLQFRGFGGLILILMGFRIFYSNTFKQGRKKALSTGKLIRDFFSVFLLTLSNPITLIVFGTMYASILPPNCENQLQLTLITSSGILIGGLIWWFSLAALVNTFRSRITLRTLWWINKSAGVIIAIFGVLILASLLYFQ